MKKLRVPFELIIILVVLLSHAYVALAPESRLPNWYQTDDAFYYFKVAQNITEGKGITFDGVNPTNGFHPLWMLICLPVFALARFNLFLPLRVLVMILALFNIATGILLYRLGKRFLSEPVGWIVSFFWMFYAAIHGITTMLGLETGVNAFSIVLLIDLIANQTTEKRDTLPSWRNYLWLGLAACLVLFSRLDNVFLVLIFGVWLVFRDSSLRWQLLVDFLLILIVSVVSYFICVPKQGFFNLLTFAYFYIALSLMIKTLAMYFAGSYRLTQQGSVIRQIVRTVFFLTIAQGIIGGVLFAFYQMHISPGFSRSVLVVDWVLSLVVLGCVHYFTAWWSHRRNALPEDLALRTYWKTWLQRAAAYFAPLGITLAAYMVANLVYAGTALPVSGQIKRWWGTLPNTVYGTPLTTLSGVVTSFFSPSNKDGPWSLILAPLDRFSSAISQILTAPGSSSATIWHNIITLIACLLILFLVFLILRKNWPEFKMLADRFALLPLFAGCFISIISYKATGYLHAKSWYWICEMVLIVLLGGILLEFFRRRLHDLKIPPLVFQWGAGLLCAFILLPLVLNIGNAFSWNVPAGAEHAYITETRDIEQITPPGAVIGMTGGGVTAYFIHDRTIINLDGLINSKEYFNELQKGNADNFFASNHMGYVYGAPSMVLDSDPFRWVLSGRLTPIKEFSDNTLYRYQ